MTKEEKEAQQAQLEAEKKVIRELRQVYERARKDCEEKIRELGARTDVQNLQSIIYQKQYQQALKKQLDGICDILNSSQFTTIGDYLVESYYNGYIGTMYDIAAQGIPLTVPIKQEDVTRAIQVNSKIKGSLYESLGEDVKRLKNSIRAELSRGISNGSSYEEIAAKIARGMNSPFNKVYNNALRIAKTEGHRVQQEGTYNAQMAAKKKGADVVKQWDSTLDGKTRPTHRELDGQIAEVEDMFVVPSTGNEALYPGSFGIAAEDINCRCCSLQRAKWALDQDELKTLQERAEFFGIDKSKDFEEFEKKYLAVYEGVPKTWKNNVDFTFKEALYGVNPNYDVHGRDFGYNSNCTNTIVAYDLRRRGYNVTAKSSQECHALKNPAKTFTAWKDGKPIQSKNGFKEIIDIVNNAPDGARYVIGIEPQYSIYYFKPGHVFVCEKIKNEVFFIDTQVMRVYDDVEKYFSKYNLNSLQYMRIDNLEVSDRGINACKEVGD